MTRTPAEIDRAVTNAAKSKLDPGATRTQASIDLSPAAIAARRNAELRNGNLTGLQLIQRAGRVNDRAQQLAKQASTCDNRRIRTQLSREADKALLTAAVQIRVAALTPLGKPHLHALTLEQIQTVEAEVQAAARVDIAALAVDVHRRLNDQRQRITSEGAR